MTKTSIMNVQGIEIALTTINEEDFICITDIVKAKGGDARAADIIKNWIRNRSTIEFLGTWETLYNPNFKVVGFDHFRKRGNVDKNKKPSFSAGFLCGRRDSNPHASRH